MDANLLEVLISRAEALNGDWESWYEEFTTNLRESGDADFSIDLADASLLEDASKIPFTGTLTDTLNRVYHYVNGHPVAKADFDDHIRVTGVVPQTIIHSNTLEPHEAHDLATRLGGEPEKPPAAVKAPILPSVEWQKLVQDHIKLAWHEAHRNSRLFGGDPDDLAEEAQIALVKAARYYDPSKINEKTGEPYKFSTLATKFIRNHFHDIARKKALHPISLADKDNAPVDVEDPHTAGIDIGLAGEEAAGALKTVLNDREREVIKSLVMADKPRAEVAAKLGVSVERVRQILNSSLQKLKNHFEMERLAAVHESAEEYAKKVLDDNGGIIPETDEEKQRAKAVDFITYPEAVEGSNCGNCKYIKKSGNGHFCENSRVRLPVTNRNCCALWDADGALRHFAHDVAESLSVANLVEGASVEAQALLQKAPDCRQPNHFYCGASATQCAMAIFGIHKPISEVAKVLRTTIEKSTDPQRIVGYLRHLGLDAEPRLNMTIDDLQDVTNKGCPVIVCCQDWMERREPRAEWQYGHYILILAVDLGMVFAQDSSLGNADHVPGGDVPKSKADNTGNISKPGRIMVPLDKWNDVWHDKDVRGDKLTHFGIVVGPGNSGTPINESLDVSGTGVILDSELFNYALNFVKQHAKTSVE